MPDQLSQSVRVAMIDSLVNSMAPESRETDRYPTTYVTHMNYTPHDPLNYKDHYPTRDEIPRGREG